MLSSTVFYGVLLSVISQEMMDFLVRDMCWKITHLKLQPYLPGASELIIVEHGQAYVLYFTVSRRYAIRRWEYHITSLEATFKWAMIQLNRCS